MNPVICSKSFEIDAFFKIDFLLIVIKIFNIYRLHFWTSVCFAGYTNKENA